LFDKCKRNWISNKTVQLSFRRRFWKGDRRNGSDDEGQNSGGKTRRSQEASSAHLSRFGPQLFVKFSGFLIDTQDNYLSNFQVFWLKLQKQLFVKFSRSLFEILRQLSVKLLGFLIETERQLHCQYKVHLFWL